MRFRSIGVSAQNISDYLTRIKEEEDNYINESILLHIGYISLEESKGEDGHLGFNSKYKLEERRKKRRRKILKFPYYRKKLYLLKQANKIPSICKHSENNVNISN